MPTPISFAAPGFETLQTTSGVENLAPYVNKPQYASLSVAENCRFIREGGCRTRNGFEQKADLALDQPVDDLETHPLFNVLFAKSSTKIEQSLNGTTFYDIGLTQTAAEKTYLFPFRKDMFAINKTDSGVRIAISTTATALVAGVSTSLTVRTGDGAQFGTSGTIYIEGDAITYTARTGDVITVTAATIAANHAIGTVVTETSTPSGFPKGSCMAELEGSAIVGGVSADPTALYWSEPSSPGSPQLFYSFPATYVKSLPSDITALRSGNSVLLIGMKKGIQYSTGFDIQTGVLLTFPLSDVLGIPGARCIVKMDDEFAILTNEGRILPVAQTDAGFRIIQNPDDPKNDMDYAVQGYIQRNIDRQTLDENFIHYDPGTRELSAVIRMKTGITREFVYQRDIRAWSNDTGKNFRCKALFKGRTYAGDDGDSFIHLDNEDWTDNGAPINVRLVTGVMRAGRRGITSDWLMHTFGGLLNATGEFYMRVVIDGEIVENKQYKAAPDGGGDSLQEYMLMDVDTGNPIGSGQIGSEQIGSGGSVADAFAFIVPYEFGMEGERAQIEWETTDEGTIFELRFFELSGETEGETIRTAT